MDKQKETFYDADDKPILDDLSLNTTVDDELKTFAYGTDLNHPKKKKQSCHIRISVRTKQQLDKYQGISKSYDAIVCKMIKHYILLNELKLFIQRERHKTKLYHYNPFDHIDSGFETDNNK